MKSARIHCETILEAPFDKVVDALMSPKAMQTVVRPIITIRPSDPPVFPDKWEEETYETRVALFGVLPMGRQWIKVEFEPGEDGETLSGRDAGWSDSIERWDHRISVRRIDAGSTWYADTVTLEAGWKTRFTAWFVRMLFRHRQRRLRKLAKQGFPGLI